MQITPPDSTPLFRDRGGKIAFIVSFAIPVAIVFGIIFLFISFRYGIQASVVQLTQLLPVGYAFAAGMVASVNPCGFFMLPSYITYHLGTDEPGFYESPGWLRALKAIVMGSTATLGFVAVFASVGTIIAVGGQWLVSVFPYAGVAIGVAMIGLGFWLLVTHSTFGIMAASRVVVTPQRNLRNVFLFGIAYAVCSLSCTLPIFLVVVGSSLATQGVFNSFGQFISYALGMGTVLIAVTLGAALLRGMVATRLRAALPYIHRTSALFLVGAGAYLIYYWVFYADFF